MKDEKKVTKPEEVKEEVQTEEKGVKLTDEQMERVTGGANYEESGPTIVHRKCF